MPGAIHLPLADEKGLGPRAAVPHGSRINAWTLEQSKKLWGELNHRTY